jgi:oligopeptide/dipeptide ABC transporter ATP-binding protein
MDAKCVMSVEDLKTYFYTRAGVVRAVDGVSFKLHEGESLGIAGESGCGKSITCLSLLRLVPQPAGKIVSGKIIIEDRNILDLGEEEMRQLRGKVISMILQDPLTSLNPSYTIGNQVSEPFKLDGNNKTNESLKQKVVNVLKSVNIPMPERRLKDYPFQFSGGMRQRVLAAMAIARNPKILIADEPTTSLDVTIQDQFLRLLKEMQVNRKMGLVMITHDLGIVAETCDRVAIMYAGKIVETGTVDRVFRSPAHPYTEALMAALPKMDEKREKLFQIVGEPPNLLNLPQGCSFSPRCHKSIEICFQKSPSMLPVEDGGEAACWLLNGGDRI